MDKKLVLAIDVGGTHISAALIDANAMRKHAHVRGEVDSNASKESILEDWHHVLASVLSKAHQPVGAAVIAIPGPFDYARGISLMDGMHKYQAILGMDVKSYFSEKYGIPAPRITFFNDAHAFLLGEVYHHQLSNSKVVGLTLGTGLGSALYEHDKAEDLNFGSSEFKEGIAEDYISTRGILQHLNCSGVTGYTNVREIVCEPTDLAHQIMAMDFLSGSLIEFYHAHLAPISPDEIVLGGSIAKAHGLFLTQVQQHVKIPLRIASFDELNLFYGMISIVDL